MTSHDTSVAPTSAQDIADAARIAGDNELTRRFAPVFERIAEGAVEREQQRTLAFDAVGWLRDAGYTRLRVPRKYGGEGIGFADYFALVARLGEADSNLPQILRVHGGFVEALLESDDEALRERWFARIARGEIIGGAVSERTAVTGNSVKVTHRDDVVQLDGEKYYTTGTLYADWIDVSANDGQSDVRILVDANAPGVERVDDWDGFGQRLTGSGTTRFHGVEVPADQLYRRFDGSQPRRNSILTPYYQTLHLANLAGITRAVLRDAVAFTRAKTRTFGVPGESRPRDNPLVQRVVGRIASLAYSAQSIVATLARGFDDVAAARAEGRADTDTYVRLDIQTFQAQQIVIDQTLEAATLLFETGGASATSEALRLDRYWRNARVLASHNPATLREAAIGHFYLNGEGHNERFNVERPAR
ncbi:acyl-CoA dehydrogenase family protein [Paraburkholderia caballeronis]|uniref:Acyl-CoA dehydrogenase n=1 Tax=Paraburkholderia caballeronis TaxID=416943 RepID=A0A1H7MPP7_9BURK|nr:acyl-CoA dehydrogenase family protein [Paraburkholderia caballeronis]PXW26486.1 alkylation response protein AidB-like acyl-CoA dehydrogenase [Paraburkholderia caballeronis]PXX02033.1 alkylation response protein AidB-like acyl-CoA dehydrogenase [Paraburkholderia caballeronis]RAK01190.1 alkylation response protein AidB-like acyl-CoA dehydrogenase [Paraburkholderia caballeronis]TDV38351.1 alkylation response protein AidB-like acyl-CoA dehydrogenase [Paraburkholderia caballeronis]SEB92764.1 Acy